MSVKGARGGLVWDVEIDVLEERGADGGVLGSASGDSGGGGRQHATRPSKFGHRGVEKKHGRIRGRADGWLVVFIPGCMKAATRIE